MLNRMLVAGIVMLAACSTAGCVPVGETQGPHAEMQEWGEKKVTADGLDSFYHDNSDVIDRIKEGLLSSGLPLSKRSGSSYHTFSFEGGSLRVTNDPRGEKREAIQHIEDDMVSYFSSLDFEGTAYIEYLLLGGVEVVVQLSFTTVEDGLTHERGLVYSDSDEVTGFLRHVDGNWYFYYNPPLPDDVYYHP